MSALEPVIELVRGLWTTLKMLGEKPVTFQYPEQKREVRPRFRGRHVLKRYDNGLEKCIGCSLCAAACPADAIFVEASENTDEKRFSPGERYASTYEINMLRCIYCGFCEDACTTEAIVLGDRKITHIINGKTVIEYSEPQIGGSGVSGHNPAVKQDGKRLTGGQPHVIFSCARCGR